MTGVSRLNRLTPLSFLTLVSCSCPKIVLQARWVLHATCDSDRTSLGPCRGSGSPATRGHRNRTPRSFNLLKQPFGVGFGAAAHATPRHLTALCGGTGIRRCGATRANKAAAARVPDVEFGWGVASSPPKGCGAADPTTESTERNGLELSAQSSFCLH
jgi:hypothetical protein